MLRWLKEILVDIDWMLTAGSALGAARNQFHIPQDRDIDLAVDTTQMIKVKKQIATRAKGTHFKFRFEKKKEKKGDPLLGRLFFSKHNGVHINLWVYERTAGFTIQELSHQTTRLEDEILFPISNCEYEGDTFPCPNNLESWVERCYGKEWPSKMQVLPGNTV